MRLPKGAFIFGSREPLQALALDPVCDVLGNARVVVTQLQESGRAPNDWERMNGLWCSLTPRETRTLVRRLVAAAEFAAALKRGYGMVRRGRR